jgi:hypothetical protein
MNIMQWCNASLSYQAQKGSEEVSRLLKTKIFNELQSK